MSTDTEPASEDPILGALLSEPEPSVSDVLKGEPSDQSDVATPVAGHSAVQGIVRCRTFHSNVP